MTLVEELLEEARRLDLSSTEGRFRLGEIAEALRRELPAATDLLDRLALDLEVDQNTITEAWFVASAFPPATRRPGLPWSSYLIVRFHPERHDLVDRAASAGWEQARIQRELSARLPPTTAARRTSPHRAGLDGLQEPSSVDPLPVGRGPVAGRGRPISPPKVRCRRWSWARPVGVDERG